MFHFSNLQVTFLSGLGTFVVILGVLLYNVALGIDARYMLAISHHIMTEVFLQIAWYSAHSASWFRQDVHSEGLASKVSNQAMPVL